MSDLMDSAVIGMPYEMAMSSEASRRQFYERAQALLAERDGMRQELFAYRVQEQVLRGGIAKLAGVLGIDIACKEGA